MKSIIGQQSLLSQHESCGLNLVPTEIAAWFRAGGAGMRGSLHRLLQRDQPHGWWMRSTVGQQSLLVIHESCGLNGVPAEIAARFTEGREKNGRIASQNMWNADREERRYERITSNIVTM